MLAKHILLEMLRNGLNAEEKAISIYAHHMKAAIFWLGIKKEEENEIRQKLERLGRDSLRHKIIVEDFIKKIEEDPRNAF